MGGGNNSTTTAKTFLTAPQWTAPQWHWGAPISQSTGGRPVFKSYICHLWCQSLLILYVPISQNKWVIIIFWLGFIPKQPLLMQCKFKQSSKLSLAWFFFQNFPHESRPAMISLRGADACKFKQSSKLSLAWFFFKIFHMRAAPQWFHCGAPMHASSNNHLS